MIDYKMLHDSVQHYEKRGFARVESPWTVTPAVSNITKPKGSGDFTIIEKNKVLVASGEQSFLYMYLKGFLPKGRFQTVTPCFRDEGFDTLHTKYFMKNELIDTKDVSVNGLDEVVLAAKTFFEAVMGTKVSVAERGAFSYDLMLDVCGKSYELGSYGIRKCEFLSWIYGTGCAEPRTSFCRSLL